MRYLRYIILFSSIVLAPLNNLFADDPIKFLHRPIIFLHGIQTPPNPENGWPTWNNPNSAMMKIINSEYSGYKAGVPLNCCKDSILYTMPDSKRIYNFSYYNPDGSRGVIGNNVNDTTEKENNPSFWKKLSYGIGYSGGLCYTGPDLKRYVDGYSYDFTTIFYWLNSIEVSAVYPLENGKGIEVGMGYGWARLGGDRCVGDDWKISYISFDIGIICSKWEYNISLCYLDALWFKNEYYGKGWGWKGVVCYKRIFFSLGNSSINHNISTTPYSVSLLFNGIGFSLNYRFNLKGGVK